MNKKALMAVFAFAVLSISIFAGCDILPTDTVDDTGTTASGENNDEHGCVTDGGYIWCEAKQKCLRTWEEVCETTEIPPAIPEQPIVPQCVQDGQCSIDGSNCCTGFFYDSMDCPGTKMCGVKTQTPSCVGAGTIPDGSCSVDGTDCCSGHNYMDSANCPALTTPYMCGTAPVQTPATPTCIGTGIISDGNCSMLTDSTDCCSGSSYLVDSATCPTTFMCG